MTVLATLCLLAWVQTRPETSFEERKLATIPDSAEVPRITVYGRDGKSVAYLAKVKNGWSVFIGDKQGEVFEDIKLYFAEFGGARCFSQDESAFAFVRVEKARSSVVVNGTAGPDHAAIEGIRLSPDGKRVAYWVKEADKYFLVFGGRKSEPIDDYEFDRWLMSADGKVLAFAARIGRELWWKVLRAE